MAGCGDIAAMVLPGLSASLIWGYEESLEMLYPISLRIISIDQSSMDYPRSMGVSNEFDYGNGSSSYGS